MQAVTRNKYYLLALGTSICVDRLKLSVSLFKAGAFVLSDQALQTCGLTWEYLRRVIDDIAIRIYRLIRRTLNWKSEIL